MFALWKLLESEKCRQNSGNERLGAAVELVQMRRFLEAREIMNFSVLFTDQNKVLHNSIWHEIEASGKVVGSFSHFRCFANLYH